jgi:hypothetical protein
MRIKQCFRVSIGGLPITLHQLGVDAFRVTSWERVKTGLRYAAACTELGQCIMHALACAARIDNRTIGEAAAEDADYYQDRDTDPYTD